MGQGVRFDDFPFNRPSVNGTTAQAEGNELQSPATMHGEYGWKATTLRKRVLPYNLCVRHGLPSRCWPQLREWYVSNGKSITGSCGGQNLTEKVYVYTNVVNANLTFKVTLASPMMEPGANPLPIPTFVLYARSECDDGRSELACSKDIVGAGGNNGMIDRSSSDSAARRPRGRRR